MSRADQLHRFAADHGWAEAAIAPLAQDAGHRRYWRLRQVGRSAVVMDAPPGVEDPRPYRAVGTILRQGGLSVPAVIAEDEAAGLLLLEDFGDGLFPALLTEASRETLYDRAVDALAVLGRLPAGALPGWGAAEMAAAAGATFLDWWWPCALGAPASGPVRAEFGAAMAEMLAPLDRAARGFAHRDYFAGNLFWLQDRPGIRAVGIIDFQDAGCGSPAYDLVSLVQDARLDLPRGLMERQAGRLLAARPELDAAGFGDAVAICAAQRHLRVAALWVRLARRDGKPDYLRHGPRCWAMLAEALTHPAAGPLARFLDRHVPSRLRCNPAGLGHGPARPAGGA